MYGHIVLHIDTQNISTDLTHILILISHILTADSGPARPTCVRMTAPRARLYGSCDFSLHPNVASNPSQRLPIVLIYTLSAVPRSAA